MERRNYDLYHLVFRDHHGSVHHAQTMATDKESALRKFNDLIWAKKIFLRTRPSRRKNKPIKEDVSLTALRQLSHHIAINRYMS